MFINDIGCENKIPISKYRELEFLKTLYYRVEKITHIIFLFLFYFSSVLVIKLKDSCMLGTELHPMFSFSSMYKIQL